MKHRRSNRLGRGLCVLWWALATTWFSLASAQAANVATPARPGAAVVAQRTVPSVTGLDLAQALSRLRRAGFDSEAISGDGSTDGRRQVTSTDLPAEALPGRRAALGRSSHRRLPGDDVQPAQRMSSLLDETAPTRGSASLLHRTLASCDVGSASGSRRRAHQPAGPAARNGPGGGDATARMDRARDDQSAPGSGPEDQGRGAAHRREQLARRLQRSSATTGTGSTIRTRPPTRRSHPAARFG